MRILSIACAFILLNLSGCVTTNTAGSAIISGKPALSASQQENWNIMVGKWSGSQPTKDGGIKKEIMVRSEHGTYQVTFRIYDKNGVYKESTEVGQWGVSGPIYFTMFRGWIKNDELFRSNPTDPYNYDAYKIIQLNKNIFEYESYSTQNKYILTRVSDDFQFSE